MLFRKLSSVGCAFDVAFGYAGRDGADDEAVGGYIDHAEIGEDAVDGGFAGQLDMQRSS
jgi:hypothetical protein